MAKITEFKNNRIIDWPEKERPREKLIQRGSDSVSSAELIAILLGQGSVGNNALETAKQLIRKFETLQGLSAASLTELQQIPGIGPAKSVTLLAAFQLYRNLQKEAAENSLIKYTNPAQVADIYIPVLGHLKKECFYVIMLDSAMKKISDIEISRGLLNASLVHPREVFNPAIKNNSKGIILIHNHPSGLLKPSEEDIKTTNRLVESSVILGIPVYDHLIISASGYFSFKENGLIPENVIS